MKTFITKYHSWLYKSDYFYNRFNLLATALEEFILNQIIDEMSAKQVSTQFESVLKRCDDIDFEDYYTAIAYVILHFLPRYHLFQLAFSKLLDKHILPYNTKKRNDILDIGTGPAPALYALSDVYESLIQFGVLKEDFQYIPDYVEPSSGFRHFLHNFTELINYKNAGKEKWVVPYHHGSFSKLDDIEFDLPIIDYWGRRRYIKHRYNIIISANFFTRLSQVEKQEHKIRECARYLRNKGLLIVLGAQSKNRNNQDKSYYDIYGRLREIIENSNYSTNRIKAKAKRCKVKRNIISFDYSSRFAGRIKEFHKKIISTLEQYNAINAITSKEVKKKLLAIVEDDYKFTYKTEVHVFIKSSYPRFLVKKNNKYLRRMK